MKLQRDEENSLVESLRCLGLTRYVRLYRAAADDKRDGE
jgi:hypothetical protein